MTEQSQVQVSWKFGEIEIQYEGSEHFLKNEFPKLFKDLMEIYKKSSQGGEIEPVKPAAGLVHPPPRDPNSIKIELSVNNIGAKIGITEGKDFAIAACAYLALVEQKSTFSRDDIREAMKSASHYYDENHRKNLSKYIATLMKDGELLERSKGIYALAGEKLRELESTLA